MKLEMFSTYDKQAKAFITPFFQPNKEMAVRAWSGACSDPTYAFNSNPHDYSLHHVGTFDGDKGTLETKETPDLVCTALDFQPET